MGCPAVTVVAVAEQPEGAGMPMTVMGLMVDEFMRVSRYELSVQEKMSEVACNST
jgi:hypothetical protein